ncbi:hypothetical protein [Chitinilyticum litopenaei]|uniref:hypothetical protein n=1 Tax=Chitinilyticum litopenaei TaxID=1121276 RepID=UPI000404E02F|nr:hypothetical protein [Chitinilyticum litopenaei]
MNIPYPYAEQDRLEERNTYFYSSYHGAAFFAAWRSSRTLALAGVAGRQAPHPQNGSTTLPDTSDGYACAELLAALLNQATAAPLQGSARILAERLLQRFEVSKRLYARYNAQGRAIIDSGYHNIDNYLCFAALCAAMRCADGALPFLNALLKCVDTLISIRDRLNPAQREQLAWLVDAEAHWLALLAARLGIEEAQA